MKVSLPDLTTFTIAQKRIQTLCGTKEHEAKNRDGQNSFVCLRALGGERVYQRQSVVIGVISGNVCPHQNWFIGLSIHRGSAGDDLCQACLGIFEFAT